MFCRLEHVVAVGDPRRVVGAAARRSTTRALTSCSWCDCGELEEAHVLLVRSRGEHRVHDGFCGVAHLLEWAKAGGRYR